MLLLVTNLYMLSFWDLVLISNYALCGNPEKEIQLHFRQVFIMVTVSGERHRKHHNAAGTFSLQCTLSASNILQNILKDIADYLTRAQSGIMKQDTIT